MAEVTDGSLWGLRLIEDLEVVLKVKYFDYFFFSSFFFLFDGWLGRGCFIPGLVLGEWLYF